jgi:hypothetical protein
VGVSVSGGDAIQFQVQYVRGPSTHDKAEATQCSAAKPDFYRIYRSEQSTVVVRGRGWRPQSEASAPKLAPLFDGSEQLIGVTSVPW